MSVFEPASYTSFNGLMNNENEREREGERERERGGGGRERERERGERLVSYNTTEGLPDNFVTSQREVLCRNFYSYAKFSATLYGTESKSAHSHRCKGRHRSRQKNHLLFIAPQVPMYAYVNAHFTLVPKHC